MAYRNTDAESFSRQQTEQTQQMTRQKTRHRCRPIWITKLHLCLKKHRHPLYVFSYNSQKHCRIFIIFGRNITEKISNQKCYIFQPHLINASALPCKTENTKKVSLHVNVSYWFANKHTSHIGRPVAKGKEGLGVNPPPRKTSTKNYGSTFGCFGRLQSLMTLN